MQYEGYGYCGSGNGETQREKCIRQQRAYRKYVDRINRRGRRKNNKW